MRGGAVGRGGARPARAAVTAFAAFGLCWGVIALSPWGAAAHQGGIEISGLEVVVVGAQVEVWVHTHLHNVLPLVPMDDNRDGVIREGEAAAHVRAWQTYIMERVTLRVNGQRCVPTAGEHELAAFSQLLHAQVRYACPSADGTLELDNRLLSEQPKPHQFLLSAMINDQEHNKMLDTRRPSVRFQIGRGGEGGAISGDEGGVSQGAGAQGDADDADDALGGVRAAAWIGVEHIIGGPDHVLFVVLLLVVTWHLRLLLAQITAFTLAHSLTLLLAVYEVVTLPAWLVESVIAASILMVALDNIWRARRGPLGSQGDGARRRALWQRSGLAFGFGLVHGLGFASALGALGQGVGWRWLLGFNLGVEAGQVAVVLLVWPALRVGLMGRPIYPRVLGVVSALSGAVALWWLWERLP
jgi:hypothetical protein